MIDEGMNGLISMSSQDGIAALSLLLLLRGQLSSMRCGVLPLLVVLIEFLPGLEGRDGSELNIEGSDGLVVLLRDVCVQIGEGMDGTVGWHDHIWPRQQVLEDMRLIDLLQHLVVMLDLIYVLELQLSLALPFFCLPLVVILFRLCLKSLPPCCLLRLFFHIHHYLTIHDFTPAVHMLGWRKGVVGQMFSIPGKFLLEVEIKFGERGTRSASSFHKDFLCGLKRIFGTGLWMESQEMIGVLLKRDYLMDCITKNLRESRCANSSFIFSIFLVTSSYSNFLLSSY